ncbi:MAG: EpsG family protein [Cetobacterium sp.]|uniref:EpsG family protein n=1 Tax=Cetobacterium sp. TaxID=2071632 RepID=UPI003F37A1FF
MEMFILLISISFIFAFIEFFRVDKFLKNLFFLITSLVIFIIIGFNRWSHDYENYLNRYENYLKIKESGFIFLVKYIEKYSPVKGHEVILIIISIVFIVFLRKLVCREVNINFIFFLYSIYPLFLDINQTKNLYMYLFFSIGVIYLIKGKGLRFLLFNFIGTQFHRVGILYFPIYFFKKMNRKKAYKIFLGLFILGFIMIDIGLIYANKYYGDKLILYIRKEKSLTPYFYLFMILGDLLLIHYISKKYKNIFKNNELNLYSIILIYPIIYIPFFFYVGNISRLYRNLFIFKYLFYSRISYEVNVKDKIIIFLYAICLALVNLVLYQTISPDVEFFKLFNENKIIYFIQNL